MPISFLVRMMIYIAPFPMIIISATQGFLVGRTQVIESGNLAWLSCFVFTICIVLFWLRERHKLIYGALEAAFAFILIWSAAIKIGLLEGAAINAAAVGNDALYALAGAVYVGVRALDNIGQGIEKYDNWYALWLWFFFYSPDEVDKKREAARSKWSRSKPI